MLSDSVTPTILQLTPRILPRRVAEAAAYSKVPCQVLGAALASGQAAPRMLQQCWKITTEHSRSGLHASAGQLLRRLAKLEQTSARFQHQPMSAKLGPASHKSCKFGRAHHAEHGRLMQGIPPKNAVDGVCLNSRIWDSIASDGTGPSQSHLCKLAPSTTNASRCAFAPKATPLSFGTTMRWGLKPARPLNAQLVPKFGASRANAQSSWPSPTELRRGARASRGVACARAACLFLSAGSLRLIPTLGSLRFVPGMCPLGRPRGRKPAAADFGMCPGTYQHTLGRVAHAKAARTKPGMFPPKRGRHRASLGRNELEPTILCIFRRLFAVGAVSRARTQPTLHV